jgi:alcohol dehydrogenase class IV
MRGHPESALVCDMRTEERMRQFTYTALPGRVVFGAGVARTRLAEEVERLGARRVLLIAAAAEAELAAGLTSALPVAATFTDVRPHVPVAIAQRARAAADGADLVLTVGGGSTTGTGKAVALETGLPIAAVPTTYAGSEMTPVWGMTEARRKTTGRDPRVLPQLVVYDPELTFTLPARITGPSAINALAHSVEAFGANPITDLVAAESIRAIAGALPGAIENDPDARAELLYGAYLAGAAFAVAGSGPHHKICHVLGGAYDLPHAELHTVMLPQVVARLGGDERVAHALGIEDAALGLHELAVRIGAPTALRDIGMREADLDEAAALVVEKVAFEREDVRWLLEAVEKGEA